MNGIGETWLILGASSGLAREFARIAAGHGQGLILAGRDLEDLQIAAADLRVRGASAVQVLRFDAHAIDEHAQLVEAAVTMAQGPLNIFLAFASLPPQQELERFPARAAQAIGANLTGAVSILLMLAPHLEQRGDGRIVIIGSVAGDRGRRRNYIYGAAKAGLEAFASGLRARLVAKKIPVTLVKPGPLDTAMTFARPNIKNAASAKQCAQACWLAAAKGKDVIYFPRRWRPIMAIVRLIPERIFKRLDF